MANVAGGDFVSRTGETTVGMRDLRKENLVDVVTPLRPVVTGPYRRTKYYLISAAPTGQLWPLGKRF